MACSHGPGKKKGDVVANYSKPNLHFPVSLHDDRVSELKIYNHEQNSWWGTSVDLARRVYLGPGRRVYSNGSC